MYMMKCPRDEEFTEGRLIPYGNIELSPGACVLNYGQGLYEGLKARRTEDGRIVIFRPDQNALRMKMGAERMCMPAPSVDQFVDAVKQTVIANKRWIPPPGKGTLYIRPLLLGSGPLLGPGPAPEFTFLIYTTPVCIYCFKETSTGLNLYVDDQFHRASPGGAGNVKSITNYAPVFKPMKKAKSEGFTDVLYLDSSSSKYVEEVSVSNIFIVKDKTISTPATSGTILAGVTRNSIIEIACDLGFKVEERKIPVEELLEADEAFCTGTASGVAPVASITYQGKRVEYKTTNINSVSGKLLSTYDAIVNGQLKYKNTGWLVEIN
ncbi:branched-chain-amino-acid aminotransferase 2, chloroplastic [Spinacia oleracea]|uniref:Branched-chain-amino-acid aminotransferase n=1 Tax=Spinacia oleracea TaxID=3562 RepID=A0A9R0JG74_SPIOL|nr:branched-chain-amino-acid aminotransferase 2, chloroplastic-like [Spinacia oleracea]